MKHLEPCPRGDEKTGLGHRWGKHEYLHEYKTWHNKCEKRGQYMFWTTTGNIALLDKDYNVIYQNHSSLDPRNLVPVATRYLCGTNK